MNKTAEKIAKILLDIKAISLNAQNPFRYTSGILSPIYTDCRLLISFPKYRKIVINSYVNAINESGVEFNVVAGTSTAGIPYAAWIANIFNLPMIYVRGAAKEHGKRNQIEGVIKKTQKPIVIEDLISTGGSSIETVNAIRNAGVSVFYIFSIITYGMKKAEDSLKKNNVELISLTDFQTVVQVAEKANYINKENKQMILEWAKSPSSWGKKMGFE